MSIVEVLPNYGGLIVVSTIILVAGGLATYFIRQANKPRQTMPPGNSGDCNLTAARGQAVTDDFTAAKMKRSH